MFHDYSDPDMIKIVNQARAERSREMARLFRRLFRRDTPVRSGVAASG
ncbi:RSP_7527 family protein [Hasllibacter sp. MH4015]|nr:hypothetical protein [Hasllibacter sp. MH4015]